MTDKIKIDFTSGTFAYRLARLDGSEHLVRAVGIKKEQSLSVADATAGLGRDGFLLAASGAKVTLIERSPEIFDQLCLSLEEAASHSEKLAAIVDRIKLIFGDSRDILPKCKADVFVVDPMHPERKKSAKVKEQMRTLRNIVGTDPDKDQLIRLALQHSPGRIVVKWPKNAALPEGLPRPNFDLQGKTVRHCVFIGRHNRVKTEQAE